LNTAELLSSKKDRELKDIFVESLGLLEILHEQRDGGDAAGPVRVRCILPYWGRLGKSWPQPARKRSRNEGK
jgi:hypothetical protein